MKTTDDFLWSEYTSEYYAPQVEEMLDQGCTFLLKKSSIKAGKIEWREDIHYLKKSLHEFIVAKEVKSVFECGCAGGHNLANIVKLDKSIRVGGCDVSKDQIVSMSERLDVPSKIRETLTELDYTGPISKTPRQYELVFTNAVTMHLAYERAVAFISNMAKQSSKYIYLMEDISQHDYPAIFAEILPKWKIKAIECGYILTRGK